MNGLSISVMYKLDKAQMGIYMNDKFRVFLEDLVLSGADAILIESILEAHSLIFNEGVLDTFKEKYLNIKDPSVVNAIESNPFNIFGLGSDKYKLYANDFISSAGKWLSGLSRGISGDVLPFFYWHNGLYAFTMKKLGKLLDMLKYIEKNDLSYNMSGHLHRLIGDVESFMGSEKEKHDEYISGPGSAHSMSGHDPIKHMNDLIEHYYGKQTNVRYKDLANLVDYK